jgi:hypothetical protein
MQYRHVRHRAPPVSTYEAGAGASIMIPTRMRERIPSRLRRATRDSMALLQTLGRSSRRLIQVFTLRRSRTSDYARWSDADNLHAWWHERTIKLAALVPPGSAVIEFGAGRRQLEALLERPARYVPSDLVDRGPGTVICDLNARPLPALADFDVDVAVFSGVFEYVVDVPAIVEWLGGSVTHVVTSYASVADGADPIGRTRAHVERLENGYMNHYTREQFIGVFAAHGFTPDAADVWESQDLFRFTKRRV